ncbi:unnamed protein product [Angiostrongylus costaricensis]|uniref:DNA-directed RNA polymerases I, II, and III subunit RPABC3 n=1 Tax=Angiostrongylus costaricensis TaxID=334426 RepID=A0A0R3Q049_ANGCS|nr:unnamed protein product [Angiostrongylus costaricensis]
MSDLILDCMFMVESVDLDGKMFDERSRPFCDSECSIRRILCNFSMKLIFDVNTQIQPVILNDEFRLMITTSARGDEMPYQGEHDAQANYSRVAQFEYVMFGRDFRIEGKDWGSDGTCTAA